MIKTRFVILLLTAFLSGCGSGTGGVPGVVGAIVTAPIIAPIMFVEARRNDRKAFLEERRHNNRPLPPIDAKSKRLAAATLRQALDAGVLDKGLYWDNHDDASGYAAGGVTVIATGRTDDRRQCREVLIETAFKGRPTDQRVRTFCRQGEQWGELTVRQR